MEQNANPPITQQNQPLATPPPPPHKDSFVFRDRAAAVHSFFKRVSLEITIGAILLLVLLGVANYYNVIPLSKNYPQILGWLPYQRESAVTNLPNQQKVGSLLGNFNTSLSPTTLQRPSPHPTPNPQLDFFNFVRKNSTDAIFNVTYEGEILKIDTNGGSQNNMEYTVSFLLKGKKNNEYKIALNKNFLNKISILQKKDNQDTSIKLTDLQIGDFIIVNFIRDFTKENQNNLLEGKITKV